MENEVLARFVDPSRMRVEVTSGSGHVSAMDTGPEDGDDTAASPMETMLGALAACTAMDVATILRKKRQHPATYEIAARGERSERHPQVYSRIVVEHRLTGELSSEAVRRSVELSATKYCPVSAMLSRSVAIEHRFRIGGQESRLVAVTGPDGTRLG